MIPFPAPRHAHVSWLALLASGVLAMAAHASPLERISPRDPIAAELRVLELYDLPADSGRFRLPHFGTWPLMRGELMGSGAPIGRGNAVRTLVAARLERELQRDAVQAFADARAARSTPRLWQREWPGDERAEFSLALEGGCDASAEGGARASQWRDGSGVHARAGVQVDRWLAFLHLSAGQLKDAERYTDVLVSNTDVAAQTDEAYLSYAVGSRWSVTMGREHFAWGPGEEGSLLLSRTAAPLTALSVHTRLTGMRADFFALHATTHPGRGEQLAAHRVEWQPASSLRLGVSEAARYRSDGWQGVYLASVIPFSLAQRLLTQDGDSLGASRNNVEIAFDAAWRVADGTRVYGELLLDDVHAKSGNFPNKYGWQLGAEGVWTHGFTRLTWNTEYTWLSRYVYTSYFGRAFVAQSAPLGFETGPDARRLRVRVSWDPRVAWQVTGIVRRTWKGAGGLDDPYLPGTPLPDVTTLTEPVGVSDDALLTLRWWPASGVDLSLAGGFSRLTGAFAGPGGERTVSRAAVAFRLSR